MKNIILTIIGFLTCILPVRSQTLYGITNAGGAEGGGTINKLLVGSNNLSVVRSFENLYGLGSRPYANVIQATDGKLYGMTEEGGSNNDGTGGISGYGVIFSVDPSTGGYAKVKDLDYFGGIYPTGNLLQANDGKLYGMTPSGGSHNYGVIFSFDPSSSTYVKLMDFDGAGGQFPFGSLMQASNGKLYGMTAYGGTNNAGVIFSFDILSSTYTRLKDLDGINGANPNGDLVQASDGKLYGITNAGGINNVGVIFSFDTASLSYTKLKDFDAVNGGGPYGSLIQANNGKFYGMTYRGGNQNDGVIFSFDPSSATYVKLTDFDYTNNGGSPKGSLMQASDGTLYGMTGSGGSYSAGVIFSFNTSTSAYTKLLDFDFVNGGTPGGSLIQATDGKLYGATNEAGIRTDLGAIFSFDPVSSTYTKLKDLGTNDGGSGVAGSLMQANNGKIYGTTAVGGGNGVGVIFSFDPASSAYTNVWNFDGINGDSPSGTLVQAGDGKLYGVTTFGGSKKTGVIFSFDLSSSTYAKLWDFDSSSGGSPFGNNLVKATDGKLYGMTRIGGSLGNGVIFSFDPVTTTYSKLKEFDETNGSFPTGNSLMQASDGKLYGMTTRGGSSGNGVIFSFDPLSSTYTKLKDFDHTNGGSPYSSLVQATDGKLYGLTNAGGIIGYGVIFSLDPMSSTYTKLKDFDNTDGGSPIGNSFLQASDGKLYAMTYGGGSNDVGVIFSFDPLSSTYTKLQDFDNTNGSTPYYGATFIEVVSDPLPVTLTNFTGKNMGNTNQLSWKADNEQNLNYYELQRSYDGQNFKDISQIKAAGNHIYAFDDRIVTISSLYYYRLKSVDKDGRFTYSAVIKIQTDGKGFAVVNPNPFKNKLVVNIQSLIRDKTTFIITDMGGRQLYKQNRLLSPGPDVIEINEAGRFSEGTYLLTIIGSQHTQSIQVIKGN